MNAAEVRAAWQFYNNSDMTLIQVRAALVGAGYPSRSVNTISKSLRAAGRQLRRPGRRLASTVNP